MVSAGQVNLAWTAVSNATSYNVMRGGVLIGSPVIPSLPDTTVSANTTYLYTVQGVNSNGVGSPSAPVSVTTPPAQVTGLVATALSSSSIGLGWNATSGANTYTVDRGGSPVGTAGANSFTDTGLTPSTSYTYAVAANGAGGQGAFSAPASATTQSGGTTMKWFPGWWLGSNAVLTNGRPYTDSHFTPEIAAVTAAPSSVVGYRIFMTWASWNPNNANGVDANYHTADILGFLSSIAPKKLAIQLNFGVFNNPTPARPSATDFSTVPSFILTNPGTYGTAAPSGDPNGLGGYYEQNTGGYCANLINANVQAKAIQDIQALARFLDGNNQVAYIGICEDSNMIPLNSTGLQTQFRQAFINIYTAARNAFQQTPVYAQATFQNTSQESSTVCQDMVNKGVLQGTADTYGLSFHRGSWTGSVSGNTMTAGTPANGLNPIRLTRVIDDNTGALAPNTTLTANGTGTGGAGTYTVTPSQTVSSETMFTVLDTNPPYSGLNWGFNCYTGTQFGGVTGIINQRGNSAAIVDMQGSTPDLTRSTSVADLAAGVNTVYGASVVFFCWISGATGNEAWSNWSTAVTQFASNPLTNTGYPPNLP